MLFADQCIFFNAIILLVLIFNLGILPHYGFPSESLKKFKAKKKKNPQSNGSFSILATVKYQLC